MKSNRTLIVAALTAGLLAHAAAWLPTADLPPSDRQYVPPWQVDVLHLALELTPEFARRTLAGQATLRFKALTQPVAELRLAAVKLTVQSVTATVRLLGWQATDEQLILTFTRPIGPETEASVTIQDQAAPRWGLYFRTPELGSAAQDMHRFTQGQSIEARRWFACMDAPNDKFTTELICRVPEGMVALSTGRLLGSTQEALAALEQRPALPAQMPALRAELTDLQAQICQLRQQMDELNSSLQALSAPAASSRTTPPKKGATGPSPLNQLSRGAADRLGFLPLGLPAGGPISAKHFANAVQQRPRHCQYGA